LWRTVVRVLSQRRRGARRCDGADTWSLPPHAIVVSPISPSVQYTIMEAATTLLHCPLHQTEGAGPDPARNSLVISVARSTLRELRQNLRHLQQPVRYRCTGVRVISPVLCNLGSGAPGYGNAICYFPPACLYVPTRYDRYLCDAGTYLPGNNYITACTACVAGTYSLSTGQSSSAWCLMCQAGAYSSTVGANTSATCLACQSGAYSSGFGVDNSSACLACQSGTSSTGISNSSLCLACQAGPTRPCQASPTRPCASCAKRGPTRPPRASRPLWGASCVLLARTACCSGPLPPLSASSALLDLSGPASLLGLPALRRGDLRGHAASICAEMTVNFNFFARVANPAGKIAYSLSSALGSSGSSESALQVYEIGTLKRSSIQHSSVQRTSMAFSESI
jgi:hypothetical protein